MRLPVPISLSLAAGALALLGAAQLNRQDLALYNASPSVPVGLYLRSSAPVRSGSFVTVRARDVAPDYAARRNFTKDGDRFIKRVAARAGERICADGDTVTVSARTYLRQAHDSAGRALPSWNGCRVLQAGEAVLMGDTPDSFDSRYFGVVRESAIEGVWIRF